MIEKERSASNPRVKVNVGQPNQRVYTKVTKNIKQKEEKIETNLNAQENSSTKNVDEKKEVENAQENNKFVKPTSTRQSVEVDKITELLKSPSHVPTRETPINEERQDKINSIVEEKPKAKEQKVENSKVQEQKKQTPITPKKPTNTQEKQEDTPSLDIKIPSKEPKKNTQKKNTPKKETPIIKNDEISNIPIEDKPKSNFLNYILILAVLIMGFFTYKNSSNNLSPTFKDLSQAIQSQYVLKNTVPQAIDGTLKFNNLPNKIQEKYVLKNEIVKSQKHANMLIKKSRLLNDQNKLLKKQIEQLKLENMNAIKITKSQNKNRDLLKENALLKKEQSSYSNKMVSYKIASKKDTKKINTLLSEKKKLNTEISTLQQLYAKEKAKANEIKQTQAKTTQITKTKISSPEEIYSNIVRREVFPAIKSTSKDYKLVKCYDLKAGDFYLSQTCKKNITNFLKNNADAKRFEVIGVVDQKDFSTFTTQDPTSKSGQELQKYSNMGLARYRVLETSWLITEVLGEDAVLTPVNYTITSKKNNRGSIIRAYYK